MRLPDENSHSSMSKRARRNNLLPMPMFGARRPNTKSGLRRLTTSACSRSRLPTAVLLPVVGRALILRAWLCAMHNILCTSRNTLETRHFRARF